jgi:hypothetical protein
MMSTPVARPPSPVAATDPGGLDVAPEVPPGPSSKELHRAAKEPQARSPSPLKCRRKQRPVAKLEELLNAVKIEDADNGDDSALAAIDAAQQLIERKGAADKEDDKELAKLPLLRPGDAFDEFSDGAKGFRYMDGHHVSYNAKGQYRVSAERSRPYENDKVHAIVTRFPTGLSWMYWTNNKFGSESLSLEECLFRFGMAGWKRPSGMQGKVIYLDDTKTMDCAFTLMLSHDGCNALSRQQEQNAGVFRVWRSAVPDRIQKVITTGELINVRNSHEAPRWWDM